MRVTMYQSGDGELHPTYEAFAKREARLKMTPQLQALVDANKARFSTDDRDNEVLYPEDVAGFIADNADALRVILNGAVPPNRGRKPAAKAS